MKEYIQMSNTMRNVLEKAYDRYHTNHPAEPVQIRNTVKNALEKTYDEYNDCNDCSVKEVVKPTAPTRKYCPNCIQYHDISKFYKKKSKHNDGSCKESTVIKRKKQEHRELLEIIFGVVADHDAAQNINDAKDS
jgi:hypothetical protein